jgi:uncharacterized protein YidB (DUF937 family)
MSEFVGGVGGVLTQILGLAQGVAGGGLPALLAQLENAGLSDRVRSWVGTDENLQVTEAELEQAFTPEQLNSWALQAGTTPEALLQIMSAELPGTVDRVTPAESPAPAATP